METKLLINYSVGIIAIPTREKSNINTGSINESNQDVGMLGNFITNVPIRSLRGHMISEHNSLN